MAVITNPPATITVDYDELEGSPLESFDATGFHVTRRIKCEWYDRFNLAAMLKGTVAYTSGNIVITEPHFYPAYTAARVTNISIEGFGKVGAHEDDTKWANYPNAVLTVDYSTPTVADFGGGSNTNDPDNAVIEEDLEPWAEFITLPSRSLYWFNGDPVSDAETPGHLQRGVQWVYKKKNMLYVPSATLTLIGCVNSTSAHSYSLGLTFAAETLLYNPPRLVRQANASGWDLEYRFTYRPTGWNQFYNPKSEGYGHLYPTSALSAPIEFYTPASFAGLIA